MDAGTKVRVSSGSDVFCASVDWVSDVSAGEFLPIAVISTFTLSRLVVRAIILIRGSTSVGLIISTATNGSSLFTSSLAHST